MTRNEFSRWLGATWQTIREADYQGVDEEVDHFVNHRLTSVRYALLTQLLAQLANPNRDILRLTSDGTPEDTAPRTIASSVLVPWNQGTDNVLGRSVDPYVNNPLRRESLLSDDSTIRNSDRPEWRRLAEFLEDSAGVDRGEIIARTRRVLRSVARRRDRQKIVYPVPERVSNLQTTQIVSRFLAEPSGGFRSLIVTTSMLRTAGAVFSLFGKVESHGINEADIAKNRAGDIMCYGFADDKSTNGQLRLVLEVKDMAISLQHIDHTLNKILESSEEIQDILFISPGIAEIDRNSIDNRIAAAWRQGVDVNRIDIETLVRSVSALFGGSERARFLQDVGEELDRRSEHRHRERWRELLEQL